MTITFLTRVPLWLHYRTNEEINDFCLGNNNKRTLMHKHRLASFCPFSYFPILHADSSRILAKINNFSKNMSENERNLL
jgi:hypothetical protein